MGIKDWKPWSSYARRNGNYSITKSRLKDKTVYELWTFHAYYQGDEEVIKNEKCIYRGKSFNECVKWYEENIR